MYIVHFKHKNDDKSGKGKEVREYKVKGGYSLKKFLENIVFNMLLITNYNYNPYIFAT